MNFDEAFNSGCRFFRPEYPKNYWKKVEGSKVKITYDKYIKIVSISEILDTWLTATDWKVHEQDLHNRSFNNKLGKLVND